LTALHPRHMSLSLKKLEGEFNLAKLGQGVTLAMSSENPSFIGPDAEEVLKALISRDIISARDPHQPLSSFRPRATWFFSCNKAIQFTDRSKGLQSKLQIIPFMGYKDRRAKGVVRDFDRKVTRNARELGVLLDWALIGAVRLRKQDDQFSELPETAASVVKTVRIEADPVSSYLYQVDLQLETACETSKEAIYDDYVKFADKDNAKAVRSQEFWRAVKEYAQRELGGELLERQPSGGSRYGKRVGRTVNVSITGLQPTGWHWETGTKVAPPVPPMDEDLPFD
jgi:phage/plasmid-associated DNA primase